MFRQLFQNMPLNIKQLQPKLVNNEIVIELTESQFKEIALQGADSRVKSFIDIKFREGKMVIKIRVI